jgi:hypothetical protein
MKNLIAVLICVVFFTLSHFPLTAQGTDWSLGFHTRLGLSQLEESSITFNSSFSYGFGLDLKRGINDRFSLLTGLEYLVLSSRYEQDAFLWPNQNENGVFNPDLPGENISSARIRYDYHYLNLLLGADYSLLKGRFKLAVSPQFHLHYLLMERLATEQTDVDGNVSFDNEKGSIDNLRPLNASFSLGLRASWQLSPGLDLYLMPAHSWMLFSMAKDKDASGAYFRSIYGQVGVMYEVR